MLYFVTKEDCNTWIEKMETTGWKEKEVLELVRRRTVGTGLPDHISALLVIVDPALLVIVDPALLVLIRLKKSIPQKLLQKTGEEGDVVYLHSLFL